MSTKMQKITYVLFAASLLTTSTAFAAPDPERMLRHLSEDLSLSEDQEVVIQKILEEGLSLCETASSREDHRACMDEKRDEVHAAIRATLLEEQQVIFDTIENEHERGPHGNPDGQRPAR